MSLNEKELRDALHHLRSTASAVFTHPDQFPRPKADSALTFHCLHVMSQLLSQGELEKAAVVMGVAVGILVDGEKIELRHFPWLKVPDLTQGAGDTSAKH